MTKDEFKTRFEEFWTWTSSRDRKESSWWESVERFAEYKFHQAYDKEKKEI